MGGWSARWIFEPSPDKNGRNLHLHQNQQWDQRWPRRCLLKNVQWPVKRIRWFFLLSSSRGWRRHWLKSRNTTQGSHPQGNVTKLCTFSVHGWVQPHSIAFGGVFPNIPMDENNTQSQNSPPKSGHSTSKLINFPVEKISSPKYGNLGAFCQSSRVTGTR